MTQIARPISDISAGSWTDEGTADNDGSLYTSLDEISQDGDTSYIQDAGANSTCEVKLTSLTDPNDDTNHVLHVYFRSTGSGGPERLEVDLIQGTTVIESSTSNTNRSGSYADVAFAITQAVNITDYSDLRCRLIASNLGGSETMRVTQVYLEIPSAGHAPLTTDTGSYTIAGQTIGLIASRVLDFGVESYVITGQALALVANRVLSLGNESYSISGQASALVANRILDLGTDSYSITGYDITLVYSGGGHDPLEPDVGSYTITGYTVTLIANRALSLTVESYTITGQAIALSVSRVLSFDADSYTISGYATALSVNRALSLNTENYIITGQALLLVINRALSLDVGSYNIVGQTLSIVKNSVFSLSSENYTISGQDIQLITSRKISLVIGSYIITGKDATLTYTPIGGYTLLPNSGNYVITGYEASLLASRKISFNNENYVITGQAIGLLISRVLLISLGSYTITGIDPTLNYSSIVAVVPTPAVVDLHHDATGKISTSHTVPIKTKMQSISGKIEILHNPRGKNG